MVAVSTSTLPPSRRETYRQATIAEIKTLARHQLTEHGPAGLSLRGIAREMRTASSALYRYFASQEDLIGALCADAYDSLADAVDEARTAQPPDDHVRRWRAIGQAFRDWSLTHPGDFALIFGTPVPGYHAPEQVTGPAAGRLLSLALTTYTDAVHAGAADPDRTQVPPALHTGELLQTLLGDAAPHPSGRLAGITLNAFAGLLGFLVTEIFGSLTQLIGTTDQLYQAHLRTIMLGMGYRPDLIDTTED
jgi:AcrR family transcriptional regulator